MSGLYFEFVGLLPGPLHHQAEHKWSVILGSGNCDWQAAHIQLKNLFLKLEVICKEYSSIFLLGSAHAGMAYSFLHSCG